VVQPCAGIPEPLDYGRYLEELLPGDAWEPFSGLLGDKSISLLEDFAGDHVVKEAALPA
jgi:hypothetical protein